MSSQDKQKILVVRNDKLGDLMLAWPAFAALKRSLPGSELHALVSAYTAEIARLCPDIDQLIIDPGGAAGRAAERSLVDMLRKENYTASITLFSTTRIGWILLKSRIPIRVTPKTKLAQIFHNKRLTQRRSRSEKPEYAYNVDLVRYYLALTGTRCREGKAPWLVFPPDEVDALRRKFCIEHNIEFSQRIVFLHPGSGGSARNLSLEQYARLAGALTSTRGHHIVISAGPGELDKAHAISGQLGTTAHTIYHSTDGLANYARHIAFCDLFIGGSTGPLHIAGALNRNTAAFYPRRRSSTALRWRTINSDERQLAISPPQGADEEDMASINPERTAAVISTKFLINI
jgi:ADP-heptose:LPS heptosyltransferase